MKWTNSGLLWVTLLLQPILSQTLPYSMGERLTYTAGFRLFKAGTAAMTILEDSSSDGHTTVYIRSETHTRGLVDRFYRVRDSIQLWLDPESLALQRVEKSISEGRYSRAFSATIDYEAGIALAGNDSIPLPGTVFDPVGAIYLLRTQPLQIGFELIIPIFDNKKLRSIMVSVAQMETVRVPAGEFECWVLSPSAVDGKKLLKYDGFMRIWFSTDDRHLPVMVEQNSKLGVMVLKLAEWVPGAGED